MHDTAAVMLASVWLFCTLAVTVIVLRSLYRWRGETVPPCDPAFDPALREDEQIAELDALFYDVTAVEPRGW